MEFDDECVRVSFTSTSAAIVVFLALVGLLGVYELGRGRGRDAGYRSGFQAGRASFEADAASEIDAARRQPASPHLVEDLRAALAADDPQAVRGSLIELESLEQMIHSQLIKVGGRQQDLEWNEALLMQRDTQLRGKLSLERDADVAQVSADLARAEMSYQSSLLVTSKLFQANLMMYL